MINEAANSAHFEILNGPDCPTKAFLQEYLKKQLKQHLAGIRPVHPATLAVATPTPLPCGEREEIPSQSHNRRVIEALRGDSEVSAPIKRLTWEQMEEMARQDEARGPALAFVGCGKLNPDYDENYTPPDDGLGF